MWSVGWGAGSHLGEPPNHRDSGSILRQVSVNLSNNPIPKITEADFSFQIKHCNIFFDVLLLQCCCLNVKYVVYIYSESMHFTRSCHISVHPCVYQCMFWCACMSPSIYVVHCSGMYCIVAVCNATALNIMWWHGIWTDAAVQVL